MAGSSTRPSTRALRTLVVFAMVTVVIFGLVALAGSWKPKLGLDLQGGTRITLIAKDQNNSSANLEEARRIIDSRVNGSGVSEAEVTTQGNRFIVVEIPGETRRDLVETVKRQAQLRFRVVARSGAGTAAPTQPASGSAAPSGLPSEPVITVAPSPKKPKASATATSSSKNRPPFLAGEKRNKQKSPSPTLAPSNLPAATASPTDGPSPTDGASTPPGGGANPDDPLQWMLDPDPESVAAYDAYTCPPAGAAPEVDDVSDQPLVTCDENGVKYLLSESLIEGSQLSSANLLSPNGQNLEFGVDLSFNGEGSDEFGRISDSLFGTQRQFAIVLDGEVISAPTMDARIHNGRAQITGSFTEPEAQSLATSLKFGALPIQFQADPPVETVGPSLAGDQLSAGLTAGAAGLLLVMLYCLLYYRGLGVVVIASLVVAAGVTYGLVLLLSEAAGFTLSLPGIAGLIVAVGITADSFVVYFERIRDEMRDGKSMRVAVEAAWVRARNTCLAADAVSLLAAVVLYVFAAGVVKGFAFALGLSTLIDLAVFFWFTHPTITTLARYAFFNTGRPMSGLSRASLGVDGPSDRLAVGGKV
ncbi:MAG: protein translocase subunit SecD [Nocardioides sp.]